MALVQRLRERAIEVPERTFKVIAFWSTLVGLVVMAAGLRALLFDRAFGLFVLFFVGGGLLASVSIVVKPRDEPGFVVTLFTREACSLCEEASVWLAAKAPEYGFTVWEVDVDAPGNEDALAQYGDHVPVGVLAGDGGAAKRDDELFRLAVDHVAVERRFKRLADARVRRS